jgi:ATP-binding cassette, subfamily C (CFTR/MRP), member 1
MIRGAIVSKIYTKVNEISITDFDDSAALTLMSTDVERVTNGLNMVHEVWANIIEVAIGLYLLQLQIGLPALTALAVALGSLSP